MRRLLGGAAVVLALAWLPGQSTAGALRLWISAGVLPLLVLFRGAEIPTRAWPWLTLVALTTLSAAWSPTPGAALFTGLVQLSWLAALVLGAQPRQLEPWPALALAGAIAALPGLWTSGGAFGNPDFLAAFLVGTVPATVSLARRPIFAASLLLQLGALARCQSLGAWAALTIAALAWGVLRGGRWRAAALALGVISGALAAASPSVAEHVRGRRVMAGISAHVIATAPLTGVGAGRLHGAWLDAQARQLTEPGRWTNAYHTHAEPTQVAAEQGLPAAALLLLPMLVALARARPTVPWATVVAFTCLGAVGLPLYSPGAGWLGCVMVGAALGGARRRPGNWVRALGLGICGLAAVAATGDLLADRLLVRASAERDPDLAATAAALSLRPARALQVQAWALAASEPAAALEAADAAWRFDPSVAAAMLRGELAWRLQRFGEAAAAFEVAATYAPRRFAAWYNLARALTAAGDRAGAARAAARARSLRPQDPRLAHLPP